MIQLYLYQYLMICDYVTFNEDSIILIQCWYAWFNCPMLKRYDAPESDNYDDSGTESDASGTGSDSSGSSGGSSSSSSEPIKAKASIKMRNLSMNQLHCMDPGDDWDETQAATNGKDKSRMLDALKKPCCKQRCKRNLNMKLVTAFCIAFWSLSKSGQDTLLLAIMPSQGFVFVFGLCTVLYFLNWLLWVLQIHQPQVMEHPIWWQPGNWWSRWAWTRKQQLQWNSFLKSKVVHWRTAGSKVYHTMFKSGWALKGVQVCRTAFLQLLGIGRGRLARTKRTFRGEDARYGYLTFNQCIFCIFLISSNWDITLNKELVQRLVKRQRQSCNSSNIFIGA